MLPLFGNIPKKGFNPFWRERRHDEFLFGPARLTDAWGGAGADNNGQALAYVYF
jgi:hypothetical protein